MKPQLTLQTPLELPYQEISSYLNKLWISEDKDNSGANTFTLMVWQPAWLEQCLVQKGLVPGPITGNLSPEIIDCLLYTSPSPRDVEESRMPSSA